MQNCNIRLFNQTKQNPPDRALDLPFFFHYEHITFRKKLSSPARRKSLPHRFQCDFAIMFVLNYRLREFLLSAFANRLDLGGVNQST